MPQPLAEYLRRHHVALLALFVALGGTSYAAAKLPRNSVGTPQIKKNAVTSAKVKNGSLEAADFAAGQLSAGARGATGPAGPAGARGDAGAVGPAGPAGSPDSGAQVLSKLAGVDGAGSGLDADLLDGLDAAQLQRRGTSTSCPAGQHVSALGQNGDVTCAAPSEVAQPVVQYARPVDAGDCNFNLGNVGEALVAWTHTTFQQGTFPASVDCGGASPPPTTIPVPQDGLYHVTAGVIWSGGGTGERGIGIKSGFAFLGETRGPASAGHDTIQQATATVALDAGEAIHVYLVQNSPSDDLWSFADGRASLTIRRVGPKP